MNIGLCDIASAVCVVFDIPVSLNGLLVFIKILHLPNILPSPFFNFTIISCIRIRLKTPTLQSKRFAAIMSYTHQTIPSLLGGNVGVYLLIREVS